MKTQEITQAVQYDKQHILKKRGLKMSRKLIASERSLIATWRNNARLNGLIRKKLIDPKVRKL